ncbi:MAG: Gfo/Idh/MocA family oxidoreductase [Acidimicrobiaceae bacterium]|nr:Gfo/Idh/MocA family oxidoreductase [Acidimicrobiaceae bacterium]
MALRWGILGAGSYVAKIAVVPAMIEANNCTISAIQTGSNADYYHSALPEARIYTSPEELLNDQSVDAVYLPLPNHLHETWIKGAIDHDKDVLCEKPLATNSKKARELYEYASSHGRILSEAYMTSYHTRHRSAIERAMDYESGEIQHIVSVFSGVLQCAESNYRWSKSKGGGALLDVGVYALAPIVELLGPDPDGITVRFRPNRIAKPDDASEELITVTLAYENGATADIFCSFVSAEEQRLWVIKEKESIEINRACTPGFTDDSYFLADAHGERRSVVVGESDPYLEMVEAVSEAILERREPSWNSKKSLAVSSLIDRISDAADVR